MSARDISRGVLGVIPKVLKRSDLMVASNRHVQGSVCALLSRLALMTIAVFLVSLRLLSQTNQGRISGAVFA